MTTQLDYIDNPIGDAPDVRVKVRPHAGDPTHATVYRGGQYAGTLYLANGRYYASRPSKDCRLVPSPATHWYDTLSGAVRHLLVKPGEERADAHSTEHPTLVSRVNAPETQSFGSLVAAAADALAVA